MTTTSPIMAQTKQETIDWLNDKFGNNQIHLCITKANSIKRVLKINSDGSFVITEYNDWYPPNSVRKISVSTFSGNFKNLSPSSLDAHTLESKDDPIFCSKKRTFISLNCKAGTNIKQIDYKEGTLPKDGQIEHIASDLGGITIAIIPESGDQSLIDRGKKAFLHLIILCGGKKEAF